MHNPNELSLGTDEIRQLREALFAGRVHFDTGRCLGHSQFNGRYCRDAARPDQWCIYCAGFMLLERLGDASPSQDRPKATEFAWPQDVDGLIAMAMEWGGVEGDDLFADDVLIHKLGLALKAGRLGDASPAPQLEVLRCRGTGNPCGTDTWAGGHECECGPCQAWLKAFREPVAVSPSPAPPSSPTGWQPIETAPANGAFLVWEPENQNQWMVHNGPDGLTCWDERSSPFRRIVTLWHPLPSLPARSGGADGRTT